MFLIFNTGFPVFNCTAFHILEENGIINKPVSFIFFTILSICGNLKEHKEAMNGGSVTGPRVYE